MEKKLGYISLGCAKNLVDTEVMLGLLKEDGYEITEDLSTADLIIINTCTFIEKAKEESINTILEAAQYKQIGACKGLIVAGCLSQQYQDELFKEIPEIDALIGTGAWNRIMDALDSICIIPKVRGAFRSRTMESILAEAKRLASMGVKEIVLIAQDTTSYGIDLSADGQPLLTDLLKALTKVEGIEWIRMLYLYPTYFSDELLDLIVHEPKIANYVDIPLQHINDKILKDMNRRDSRSDIETLLKKIRAVSDHVTLRTSIIVGFPGEIDQQFEELCQFVKDIKFDNMGVFTYSQEEGTIAGARKDQVPEAVKEERYHTLMAIQAAISEENNRNLEGTIHQAMVEEIEEEAGQRLAKGRLMCQAPDVDGNMFLENARPDLSEGDIIRVEVEQGFAYDVVVNEIDWVD